MASFASGHIGLKRGSPIALRANAANRCRCAGFTGDPNDSLDQRFDDNLHMMAAGVDHAVAVDKDGDMAPPEDKIASGKLSGDAALDRFAEHQLL